MGVEVNYWAVLLAALSSMVVGSLWYAQAGFGKMWSKLAKVNMNRKMEPGQMAWMLGSTFVASLVTAYILAHMTFLSHKFFGNSLLQDSLTTAFWLWLGFTAARVYVHDAFESRPAQLTLLTVTHELVTVLLMGLIIGLMPV
jgi:hypothetical protein